MHHWITDPTDLAARLAHRPTRVGLDTEFIRERTYWPQLALVQIALDDADGHPQILLVDTLRDGMNAALAPMLADPAVLKVMHSASEDIVAFKRACGVAPTPLFDTQIAAGLAGIGAGMGYQRLVQEMLGVTLAKGEQRSDWLRRPLSDAQLQYAADDVVHLDALYRALSDKLDDLGRRAWLDEDSARLAQGADEAGERWPHLALRAAQFLDTPGQHRLLRLLRWRDAYARSSDRPRSWILDNELATTLARTPPIDRDALKRQLDAIPKSPRSLVDALWNALTTPLPDEAESPPPRSEERDKAALRKLQDMTAQVASELGLPDGVLASRRWLETLLDGHDWPGALSGWRRQQLEARLKPLLAAGPN
ncbi:Ribonuclease D [Lysobacter dokdonensis DS-58]|uniref:Ribonuclease D n=1 Tax=Lysobacter dokdonensis DS-58 TaxID=1300345 RepID=A0A0A2X6A3_9GAMM|nr:ribonuclease D [Lysobacter dokdonensis]KGQ20754.1 Ribonuclease D [Lysobacter dokdonensis DS-58]